MENQQNYDYEEISIKELIETLLKGKWLIAGITLVLVLIAIGFTFFYQTPMYEATTTLLASNVAAEAPRPDVNNIEDYLNTLSSQGSNTLDTYKQQIKSPEVIASVREDLELDPEKYSIVGLQNSISVQVIDGTNLIKITVTSDSPEMSKNMANSVADNFIDFVSQINEKRVNQSAEFLKVKIDEQEVKLQDNMAKYEVFLDNNSNLQTVKNEIEILLEDETEYKAELASLDQVYEAALLDNRLNISRSTQKIAALKKVIGTVNRKLETNTTVLGNDLLRETLRANGLSTEAIAGLSLTEETYNENYLTLQDQLNQMTLTLNEYQDEKGFIEEEYEGKKEVYSKALETTTERLETLQLSLTELSHQDELLQNEIETARQTYKLLVNKYDEIQMTESVRAGEMNLVLNSTAFAPKSPVSPNKKLNVAIALVLGLMLGVFVVFFKSMWDNEEA